MADLTNLKEIAQKEVQKAAADLAAMAKAKIHELANQKLHARRQLYVDHLSYSKMSADVYVVTLEAKARWIEDGQQEHSMIDDLLASPKAKTARDGSKYLVVPFGHGPGKGSGSNSPPQNDIVATLKKELKKRGVGFGKIERNPDGTPKTGRLHSFDISKDPLKSGQGPGQGWGPVGQVRQGPNQRQVVGGGPGGGGTPFLHGISIYQTPDDKAKSGVKRSITTYRIVSSKHASQGRWMHPGLEAVNLMDLGFEWALQEWETKLGPEIVAKITSSV